MKPLKTFPLIIAIFAILGCQDNSKKKVAYELQEKCAKSAEQWAKNHSEIQDYQTHYNTKLNKCFILANLEPIFTQDATTRYYILYDVNENKEYGHNTVRSYTNGSPESYQAQIKGKYISGAQAKGAWDSFAKEIMEQ